MNGATAVDRVRRLRAVRDDLAGEQRDLDDLVAPLSDEQWRLATPSPGWTVADQIGHLAYFDGSAARAILDPEGFGAGLGELARAIRDEGIDEYTLGPFRTLSPQRQLAAWRDQRASLAAAIATLHEGARVSWYGPAMGAASFVSARLMETWAHGTDVADALGVSRVATDRLEHVARLGYLTRDWSYRVRGENAPEGRVRVELLAPSGLRWTWGDEQDEECVRGSAEEFCLVVTQRRHVDDTSLETGELGREWLLRAQAFAGAASDGPQPRSTRGTRRD